MKPIQEDISVTQMSSLTLTNLCKNFGTFEAFRDINLDIASGEFIAFVGPSGCGKSTLLRAISGLEEVSAGGSIELGGEDITHREASKRGIAMVFQSYALYPHLTVRDNMGYSLRIAGVSKDEIKARVEKAAETLHLTEYLHRQPKELSGGQRQRVAIGRAIVREPRVFLFDEPLSNLDAALRMTMRMEIARLKRAMSNTTMIYVTHDQVEAMTLADRIVLLDRGEIRQVGTPMELYNSPQTIFVAEFIGSPKMNIIGGEAAKAYSADRIGVRAEHLNITTKEDGIWSGTVEYSENLGSDIYAHIDIGRESLIAVRYQSDKVHETGTRLHISPFADKIHRFDANGMRIADDKPLAVNEIKAV